MDSPSPARPLPALQAESLGGRLLTEVSAESGEWGVASFARRLKAPVRSVETKVAELRRRRLLEPPAYRLAPGVADDVAGRGAKTIVGHGALSLAARDVAIELVEALAAIKAATSRELALHLGVARLSGQHHRLLQGLHGFGTVALPRVLWSTERGDELVAKWNRATGEATP